MANICLTFGTAVPVETVRKALTTLDGLRSWWTGDTTGNPEKGGTLLFRFGDNGGFDMKVIKFTDRQIHWQCTEGPDEWLDTTIEFDLRAEEHHTQLMFRHAGWQVENPFFHHCSMKWATFLLSLKQYVEKGRGQPFPQDIKIEATGM